VILSLRKYIVGPPAHSLVPVLETVMALSSSILMIIGLTLAFPASAGPLGYGICQAGCSAVVMACYSAARFT
jgi:hypothetical protein